MTMFQQRLLPWEYGIRNLLRRPSRTALTLLALTLVVFLIFVVVAFIRGLEKSLAVSGDRNVVLVYAVSAEANIENSSIAARTPDLLAASLPGVQQRYSVRAVSPELYLGTRVQVGESAQGGLGIVRGITTATPLVRRQVRLISGKWPGTGEIMIGRLVATKLGCSAADLQVGKELVFEKRSWKISGQFAAGGSAFESEIWCSLPEFQQATKRQDLSLVALMLQPGVSTGGVELFCKERTDLELQAVSETAYYASLQKHYKPMRILAWMIVGLVSGAGVFAGLNMMYGAVAGRIREIATLQAVGYRRRAVLISLIQEGGMLATAAALLAAGLALTLVNGAAVRFTMGAFELQVDSTALLVGGGIGLLLGICGAIPPAVKVLRQPVVQSLKAV